MKRAFTIIELLITVVVIITLLAITFRIASIGSDASARNETIHKLQRMENALSGYYSAFGSYPPVKFYEKSRNVYAGLDSDGEQDGSEDGTLDAKSVMKVCKAQPVAACFPIQADMQDYVNQLSRIMSERANSSDPQWKSFKGHNLEGGFKALSHRNDVSNWDTAKAWGCGENEVKIFKFGLMSYLLPRYLFMTGGIDGSDLDLCEQWKAGNQLSARQNTGKGFENWATQLDKENKNRWLVLMVPSQAVCARWMPNLEKTVIFLFGGGMSFFGVDVCEASAASPDSPCWVDEVLDSRGRTILNAATVHDGWGQDLMYHSDPPYQSYYLWSAGPNDYDEDGVRETFPPWVPLDSLKSDSDRKKASNWMADDIMFLNN